MACQNVCKIGFVMAFLFAASTEMNYVTRNVLPVAHSDPELLPYLPLVLGHLIYLPYLSSNLK